MEQKIMHNFFFHPFSKINIIDGWMIAAISGGKKGRKKKPTKNPEEADLVIDESSLSIDFHSGFVAALATVQDVLQKIESELRVLLIGLGGGNLPVFLHTHFKQVS